ncbi:ImmA/IrrE family metallo-endopeptidase [Lactococcus lactis]|uniref:ImmA/IrrE family metallo-endopeptidase n=1 Tax=Lactococcus lactis TaxID=1358 RepID=UPI0026587C40|nr:ImmA/IrrE family metallo-endopeptidase [Lactococcus lactis]WKG35922.1 ImmA/IrrE family metallo-endopeptidase [Lactococcus lactis subsp. lactis]
MNKLSELSHELGAEIAYFSPSENDIDLETEIKGLYFPEDDIIYIRDDLSTIEQENVILHELGHCHCGHIHYSCHSRMYGSKQEAEADYYMIIYRFNDWLLSWDFAPDPNEINITQFMSAYKFSKKLKWLCEKVIDEYTTEYCEAI